ncbi:MAG: hypothetical protein VX466_02620 [Myxococcota bacterium]|nr:hypothetical protein [Myxococcota bacterium]
MSAPVAPLPPRLSPTPREATSLQVRLVFGAEADADLFVSDPDLETVYFGNNPSLGGGVLAEDIRCNAPPPRVEVVTFRNARPGRYRIGVEHARRCTRSRLPVPYRIEVVADESDWSVTGEIAPGAFDNRALEFDLHGSVASPIESKP